MKKLLKICQSLEDFDFTLLIHSKYVERFQGFGFKIIASSVPEKLRFFASSWIVRSVVSSEHFDLVYGEISHVPYFCKIPAAIKVHDLCWLRANYPPPNCLKDLIYRETYLRLYVSSLRHAKLIGAISRSTANDILKYSRYRGPIEMLNPAFEPGGATQVTKEFPSPEETLNILYVGNIHPRKNVPFMLKAVTSVKRKWRLDVVGNLWSDTEEVFKLTAADSRIAIRGYVNEETLSGLYKSAHLLIMPSLCEGFGFPVIEASNYNCLPLASRGSCFEELLPDACLFSLEEPVHLSLAIDALTAHDYNRLMYSVRTKGNEFSFARSIDDYRKFFLKAIN